MASACSIRVRGVVQGVGFRPFVYRLAQANTLAGWVLNGEEGVEIYLEGAGAGPAGFCARTQAEATSGRQHCGNGSSCRQTPLGLKEFTIRESQRSERPTVRISPDLPVCEQCLEELFRSGDPRYLVSVHQLHKLWPALHGRFSGCPMTVRTPR